VAELRNRVTAIVDDLRGQIDAGSGNLPALVLAIIASLRPDLEDLLPWFAGEMDVLVNELAADIDEMVSQVGEDNNSALLALAEEIESP
jgi:hypothetical protein